MTISIIYCEYKDTIPTKTSWGIFPSPGSNYLWRVILGGNYKIKAIKSRKSGAFKWVAERQGKGQVLTKLL